MSPERNKLAANIWTQTYTHIHTHTWAEAECISIYCKGEKTALFLHPLSIVVKNYWSQSSPGSHIQLLPSEKTTSKTTRPLIFVNLSQSDNSSVLNYVVVVHHRWLKMTYPGSCQFIGNWKNNVETKTEREGLDTARQDWGFGIIVKEESQTNAQDNQKDRLLPKANKVQYIFWLWQ